MKRILGIDHGDVRVGIAVSDREQIIATPRVTLQAKDPEKLLADIVALCEEIDAEKIVIGLPLNMNGTRGPAVDKVEAFVTVLESATGLPVITWDERLTSVSAQAALRETGVRKEKRKQFVDQAAAQLILQGYLDAQGGLPPNELPPGDFP